MPIATINPATGETERTFEPHGPAEVERRLADASCAFVDYRRTGFDERARWMQSAAGLLEGELPEIARVLTVEMGKTFASAKGEVAKCAAAMRYFAEQAEGLLAEELVDTASAQGRVRYRPMGAILAVMPWNFPMWQVVRFAAPNLMAGNVGVLKHASNVPQTALLLEDLFRRAGFPPGVFTTLLVEADRVAGLIGDPRIAAVTLTGSEAAGRAVGAAAGRAIKKSVLELGGSDPFVVLASADLERAVAVGVQARVQNNGQSCIAAKRFIVHAALYDEFTERFCAAMDALEVGDPMAPSSEVGPLATASQRDAVTAQVDDARARGAQVLCGGAPLRSSGFYYRPTVLGGVGPDMAVDGEEVFGPVATLYRVSDADEALALANRTRFGLAASVWSSDAEEIRRFEDELEVGMVFVNAMVASMPELPFGGTKDSGYGRELSGLGLKEFCEATTVFERP